MFERCVLRMDHHCPWTGNCVALYTHKYFCLFLFYAIICVVHILIITNEEFVSLFKSTVVFFLNKLHSL